MCLLAEGEHIRGRGWLARARRLLEEVPRDCAETGFLLTADARGMLEEGNVSLAATTFEQARQIGQRFGEADLVAIALLGLASCRVRSGPPAEGLACLDEAMIAVESGEVTPVVSAILYCAVINLCHDVFDLRRAQEWTAGLTGWCAEQPDLVPFRGQCQVHRAQVLQLHGAWSAAMDMPFGARQLHLSWYAHRLHSLRLARPRIRQKQAQGQRVVASGRGVVERDRHLAVSGRMAR